MSTDQHHGPWFTEQQAMLVFALFSIVLAALVILPYVQFILLGMVFAYVVWPLRIHGIKYFGRTLTALSLTLATVVAILLPLSYLTFTASRQALEIIQDFEAGALDIAAIERQLASIGLDIDLVSFFDTYRDQIGTALELVAWTVFDIVRSIPQLFIGLIITVFVLFILLREGDQLIAWTRSILPFRGEVQDELNERLDRLTRASVLGNVVASLIQAVALAAGLWYLGFENVIFLGVLTFILALLPLVGAFLVWIPLVFFLFAVGDVSGAVLLTIYGSLVSISDFYTRPIVIGHSAALNSAIIVVGVFGGIVAFGAIGLLVGPVVLGGAKIFVEVLMRERRNHLTAIS